MADTDDRHEAPMIGWLPYEGEFLEGCPFTTFGLGFHEGDPARSGLDPEIADLVAALNEAGVPTVQSCQEITAASAHMDPDVCRMGAVLVRWDDFPALCKTLPGCADGNSSGRLFAAAPREERTFGSDSAVRHVTAILPWRDHDAWLAAARKAGGASAHSASRGYLHEGRGGKCR